MDFLDAYDNKNVFVTGHSGFKGSWLVAWLNMLNANVSGYSLDASGSDLLQNLDSKDSKNKGVTGTHNKSKNSKNTKITESAIKDSINIKNSQYLNTKSIESNNLHYKLPLDSKCINFINDICGDVCDYKHLENALL